jgi:hypothetical protein
MEISTSCAERETDRQQMETKREHFFIIGKLNFDKCTKLFLTNPRIYKHGRVMSRQKLGLSRYFA